MIELIEKQLKVNSNRKISNLSFLTKGSSFFNKLYRNLDLDNLCINDIYIQHFLINNKDELYDFRFNTKYGNFRLVDYIAYLYNFEIEYIEDNILNACFLSNPNFCVLNNDLINKNIQYLDFQNCRNRIEYLEIGNFLNLKDNNINDKKDLFSYYLYLSGIELE